MSDPGPPRSYVAPAAKVGGYHLDTQHPRGASKAKFFLSFGFSVTRPEVLAATLFDRPRTARLTDESLTPRGQRKLVYEGPIRPPDGRSPHIRTVWQVNESGEAVFVTAVPLRASLPTENVSENSG